MQISSSSGNYALAPAGAPSSIQGGAQSLTPKEQLANLKLQDAIRNLMDETLARDNDAMTMPQSVGKGGVSEIVEKLPIDLKELRKHRVLEPVDDVEDNTTFQPPAGTAGQGRPAANVDAMASSLQRQHAQRLTRDSQMLDAMLDSLRK